MGDENPIRTLGDYSKPSHKGYRNTIELPVGNNVVPLRSYTIRLVQNGCSFHGLRSEDPNQHLKDFLKLVDSLDGESLSQALTHFKDLLQKFPHHGIDLWLKIQIFYDHVNPVTRRTIDQSAGEKEHTKSVYLRNDEDRRRGVEYLMSKILGFYKECLELGPEYVTGIDDEGEVTKFLIKNEEEIFTDAGDGVRIYPDGVASPAMLYLTRRSLEDLKMFSLDDS
ncbi:hypothetical protein Tco_0111182 [Tanacetum coccineum]